MADIMLIPDRPGAAARRGLGRSQSCCRPRQGAMDVSMGSLREISGNDHENPMEIHGNIWKYGNLLGGLWEHDWIK